MATDAPKPHIEVRHLTMAFGAFVDGRLVGIADQRVQHTARQTAVGKDGGGVPRGLGHHRQNARLLQEQHRLRRESRGKEEGGDPTGTAAVAPSGDITPTVDRSAPLMRVLSGV